MRTSDSKQDRLSFHVGGSHPLDMEGDKAKLETLLQRSLQWATKHGVEDVSLHPPVMTKDSQRAKVREHFRQVLQAWLPQFSAQGVTLSVETMPMRSFGMLQGFTLATLFQTRILLAAHTFLPTAYQDSRLLQICYPKTRRHSAFNSSMQ